MSYEAYQDMLGYPVTDEIARTRQVSGIVSHHFEWDDGFATAYTGPDGPLHINWYVWEPLLDILDEWLAKTLRSKRVGAYGRGGGHGSAGLELVP